MNEAIRKMPERNMLHRRRHAKRAAMAMKAETVEAMISNRAVIRAAHAEEDEAADQEHVEETERNQDLPGKRQHLRVASGRRSGLARASIPSRRRS